jgi:hypothetical protein
MRVDYCLALGCQVAQVLASNSLHSGAYCLWLTRVINGVGNYKLDTAFFEQSMTCSLILFTNEVPEMQVVQGMPLNREHKTYHQ